MHIVHPFSSPAQSSICIPISELLKGRRTWDSPLTNLHKSSAHFTSRWFGSYSTEPFCFCSRQQLGRKSCPEVCFTVDVHPSITHHCKSDQRRAVPNKNAINQEGSWKQSSCYCGFFFSSPCIIATFLVLWIKVNLSFCWTHALDGWNMELGGMARCHGSAEMKNTNNWWCFCCFDPDSDSFRSRSLIKAAAFRRVSAVPRKGTHIPWIFSHFVTL